MSRIPCEKSCLPLKTGCVALFSFTVAFAFLVSAALLAEEPIATPESEKAGLRLTLEDCLRRAIAQNLSLSAQSLDIGIASQGVISARAPFDAQLGLDLLYEKTRSKGETAEADRRRADLSWTKRIQTGQEFRLTHTASRSSRSADLPMSPFYDLEWTISATQPLAKGAGRVANMAPVWVARNEEKKAVLTTEEAVMDLVETVEATYLDLIYAIRYLDVQQSALKLAQELLSKNEELARIGKLPAKSIEVLQAKASLAAREEGAIITLNDIAKAEDAIRRLLNLPVQVEENGQRLLPADEPLVDLKLPKVEESLAFALAHRPRVRSLQLSLDSTRLELAAAKNNCLPEVDLRADVGFTGSNDAYGSSFEELTEGRDYVWQVGLSVSVPWGNRAARSRYAQAKLNYERAEILLDDFLEQVRLEVINAHRDVDRDINRMASTKAALEQAELQLRTENELYAQGMSNSFRLLQFQDDLTGARVRHLAATIDFNRSYFSLLRAEGSAMRNDRFDLTDIVEKLLRQAPGPRRPLAM